MSWLFRIEKKYVSMPQDTPEANAANETSAEVKKANAEASRIVREAREQAEEILNQAKQSATIGDSTEAQMRRVETDAIIENAKLQAEKIHAAAEKEGYEHGLKRAEEESAAQLEEARQSIAEILAQLEAVQQSYATDCEREVLGAVTALAKKIINATVQTDDVMYESMITNALRQMKRSGKITMYVTPSDYRRFLTPGSASYILDGEQVNVHVVEDESLPQSGLRLESELETVDAGIDTQMKKIELAFDKMLENDHEQA